MGNLVGWKIHQSNTLYYKAQSGTPLIEIKGYLFPNYNQKVVLVNFEPKIRQVAKRSNQQWYYSHKSKRRGRIDFSFNYNIFPDVKNLLNDPSWGNISSDTENHSTSPYDKYWPIKADPIENIANEKWFLEDELKKWVILSHKRIREIIALPSPQQTRNGVISAIKTGIGDCDEYTDIFITLARKRGLKARRLTGYFIKNERDPEAHAWSEVFSSEKGWIHVDIALNIIGNYNINYVVQKVEEFVSDRRDLATNVSSKSKVDVSWDTHDLNVEPIFE